MSAIRVGIVGGRGEALMAGLRSVPGVELTAFCEKDTARLEQTATRFDIARRFTCYEDMLDAVDAVVVATPMQLHAEQSVSALNAGKHVLSEVTACVSMGECWKLLKAAEAAARRGVTYMMAENACYGLESVLVREMCRTGLFGDLYFGEGEYLHEVRHLHHHADGSPTWRYFYQVGTPGATYPTHSLGPVMQWFKAVDPKERIESVICLGSAIHTDPEHPHDDTTVVLCKLASGKLVKIRVDMMSNRPYAKNFSLQGTRGVYESSRIDGAGGYIWVGEPKDGDHRQWRPAADFKQHLPPVYQAQREAARNAGHGGSDFYTGRLFAQTLLTGGEPDISIYDALEWTAAGLLSTLSVQNGGVAIRVPNFRDARERPLIDEA